MQDGKNERSEFSSSKQQHSLSDKIFFLGVMTAVSVVCVQYESYVDGRRFNEQIYAYAGDVRVATI